MNFAILRRPRTQALLDGKLPLPSLPIRWFPASDPLGWNLSPHEAHRDIRSGHADGGEMSISSFVQAKSQGAQLWALPIFLKRGLVQRSLFCLLPSPLVSPQQLAGKRVGLVSYTSSMAIWMRGVLEDEYGLMPSSVQWFALSGSLHRSQALKIPEEFFANGIQAWEELDGYPHELDRRESFFLSLLERADLDAVVSFQARIASNKIRPLVPVENNFWSHFRKKGVYPINHVFVVREHVLKEFPQVAAALLSVFSDARRLWVDYLPMENRAAFQSEMDRLGWDPFGYSFGEVEKRSLETFVEYLHREQLISQKFSVNDMFPPEVVS
jgi:4,5-dihydroxyphthalate decarboxylase